MRNSFSILLLTLLLSIAACGDETPAPGEGNAGADVVDESPPPEYPSSGVMARFDLEATAEDFFAYPYPSDLRLNETGGPDLASFPTERAAGTLLEDAIQVSEETLVGFSNVPTVYFTFEGPLDPASFPTTREETIADDAAMYLLDVDADSPWYGRRHPVHVYYRENAGVYWTPNTLMLQPLFGFPLRSDTTYAAVITTSILDIDGLPAIGPDSFRDLFDNPTPTFLPLIQTLDVLGVHRNTIAVATVFTTGHPARDLWRLREWMHDEVDAPTTSNIFLSEAGYVYDVYEGTFSSEEFLEGSAPYRAFGTGRLTIDRETGEPSARTPVDLRFALSIPSGIEPADGWPVVLYHHGTGGDYRSVMRGSTAREMARRGIACLGIDQPLHGARNPTSEDELDLIISLAISNIVIGRDMLRQGAVDLFQATRLLRDGMTIPAGVSATGFAIHTDPNRVVFMGHSQGAQVGAIFMGIEPDIQTGMLSEGAGGAAISLLERKANDLDIRAVVETAMGINAETERLTLYHPVAGIVIQPLLDPADPLSYARHVVLEPFGDVAHNLLMSEGFADEQTPPAGIESLAAAMGLPIAEPVYNEVEAMQLQGIPSVALPTSQNLPAYDGNRPTGALIQFPGRNHYVVSRDIGAQYQVYEFLNTAMAGQPFVFPAEDR
jgi:pimeloyl-ACP methyl ester carboxylesterase